MDSNGHRVYSTLNKTVAGGTFQVHGGGRGDLELE
jgi:hypothetical protein